MLRSRGKSDALRVVRNLDAFPKVSEECQQSTKIGGTLSVVSCALIALFVYNEVMYYMEDKLKFEFKPDTDMDSKLYIHIDVTIASPCSYIGADILDSTNQNVFSFGTLEEQDTWWELCPIQRTYFEYMQHLNQYLREQYHSLTNVIFKEMLYKGNSRVAYNLPERSNKPNIPFDACRVHGSLVLNKVSGNFHITGGKSIHFGRGHIHITSMFGNNALNFTHRINRLSFGDHTAGIVHPLEGDERILTDSNSMAQYFIEVVPTELHSFMSHIKTYQYSVKENTRPINHDKGSHGIPGLYFKYDMSALKVIVRQDRENLVHFLVRLCSVIAGIIVISGFLNSITHKTTSLIENIFLKRFTPELYQKLIESRSTVDKSKITIPNPPKSSLPPNVLLQNAEQMANVKFNFTAL